MPNLCIRLECLVHIAQRIDVAVTEPAAWDGSETANAYSGVPKAQHEVLAWCVPKTFQLSNGLIPHTEQVGLLHCSPASWGWKRKKKVISND